MKTFFMSFGLVLIVGVVGMIAYAHHHNASSDDSSALASIPNPTGGDPNSSDLKSPNAPYSNAQKVETEDEKNAREQNWKADHVQQAGPGDSNVSAEDMQELQDTETAKSTPTNKPK